MITVPDREGFRHERLARELRRRMSRPQRHRLLQGYPMAPLMQPVLEGFRPFELVELDPERPLIIGVIPHTFCNPRVRGCGFCTFPHERLSNSSLKTVIEQVGQEIKQAAQSVPILRDREVEAVYFGGGTANLTPPAELERLFSVLSASFDVKGAELTLEGVPGYFLMRDEALLDALGLAPVRHRRISMGVQTFDGTWLERMGRGGFGDRDVTRRVVDAAHRRGFTTSADLLYNLPGAPLDLALSDVRAAVGIGFDQICVYNLVLNAELETEWARQPDFVQAMPAPSRACATWLVIRETLIDAGFVQTTLTNFERREVAESERRFRYEVASFEPRRTDGIGFGPCAISTLTARDHRKALKWNNLSTSEAFAQAMVTRESAIGAAFEYTGLDLRLLHITRSLSGLSIDLAQYEGFFGTDLLSDFPRFVDVLEEARLLRNENGRIGLTPEGMFYADAVAGLFAHERVSTLRRGATDDELSIHQAMG